MHRRIPILCIALVLLACQNTSPPTSDSTRLAEAYSALLILNARYATPLSTTTVEQYQLQVDSALQQHDFTRESFLTALRQVTLEPAQFRTFSQSVAQRLSPSPSNP